MISKWSHEGVALAHDVALADGKNKSRKAYISTSISRHHVSFETQSRGVQRLQSRSQASMIQIMSQKKGP